MNNRSAKVFCSSVGLVDRSLLQSQVNSRVTNATYGMLNPLAIVYFETENNSFWAALKSARGAGLESAHLPAMARDEIGVQA